MNTSIQPMELMSPGDNLEAYIRAVNSIPMLSAERETELANALYAEDDLDANYCDFANYLRAFVRNNSHNAS